MNLIARRDEVAKFHAGSQRQWFTVYNHPLVGHFQHIAGNGDTSFYIVILKVGWMDLTPVHAGRRHIEYNDMASFDFTETRKTISRELNPGQVCLDSENFLMSKRNLQWGSRSLRS